MLTPNKTYILLLLTVDVLEDRNLRTVPPETKRRTASGQHEAVAAATDEAVDSGVSDAVQEAPAGRAATLRRAARRMARVRAKLGARGHVARGTEAAARAAVARRTTAPRVARKEDDLGDRDAGAEGRRVTRLPAELPMVITKDVEVVAVDNVEGMESFDTSMIG